MLLALVAMLATTVPARPEEPTIHDLIRELVSAEPETRTKAADALLAIGPPAIEPLLKVAAGRNEVLAIPARELLPRFGPSSLDTFVQVHNHPRNYHDKALFHEATRAVAAMGPAVIPRMTEMLSRGAAPGSDPGFATFTLSKMDGPAAEALVPLLKHSNGDTRVNTATILAGLADPRSFDALVAGLHDEHPAVRMVCAQALGAIGDHRAAEPLLLGLEDPEWAVRRGAAAALGKLWEPRFRVPVARMARNDSEVLARDTAANVLRYWSHDPVAIRLGWRYGPATVEPMAQANIMISHAILLGFTWIVLLAAVAAAPFGGGREGVLMWIPVAIGLLVAAVAGFAWGWQVKGIPGSVENALLLVVIPGWAAVVLVAGRFFLAPEKQTTFRGACAAVVVGFYVAYGIGWLKVWGYL